jgi:cytochrome b involved in lipid metabolism
LDKSIATKRRANAKVGADKEPVANKEPSSVSAVASASASVSDTPSTNSAQAQFITYATVAQHASANDCWMILCENVYDLTKFAKEHPGSFSCLFRKPAIFKTFFLGGSELVTNLAGMDGTKAFLDAHPPTIIKTSLSEKEYELAYKGKIDTSSEKVEPAKRAKISTISKTSVPGPLWHFGQLFKAVLVGIFKSAFASTAVVTITRSALFLIRFVIRFPTASLRSFFPHNFSIAAVFSLCISWAI